MAITAGTPDAAIRRALQICPMAERTGGGKVAGSFVTVGRSAAPGGERVSGILGVAIFTAVGQISQHHIKAWIAAGATV